MEWFERLRKGNDPAREGADARVGLPGPIRAESAFVRDNLCSPRDAVPPLADGLQSLQTPNRPPGDENRSPGG